MVVNKQKSTGPKWTLAQAWQRVKSVEDASLNSHEIDEALRKRMISGEWLSSGTPESAVAEPVEFEPGAWSHFHLWLADENMLVQSTSNRTEIKIYLVKVWPAPQPNKAGRPNEKLWVKSWAKQNHPGGVPEKNTDIIPGLMRDFKREQADRRLAGKPQGSLTERKAREYLTFYRNVGYDADEN